jgi:hypothetical protein
VAISVKQAVCRGLDGHWRALSRRAAGLPFFESEARSFSDVKGRRTLLATLHRWGAVDGAGDITPFGREVLEAARAAGRSGSK